MLLSRVVLPQGKVAPSHVRQPVEIGLFHSRLCPLTQPLVAGPVTLVLDTVMQAAAKFLHKLARLKTHLTETELGGS